MTAETGRTRMQFQLKQTARRSMKVRQEPDLKRNGPNTLSTERGRRLVLVREAHGRSCPRPRQGMSACWPELDVDLRQQTLSATSITVPAPLREQRLVRCFLAKANKTLFDPACWRSALVILGTWLIYNNKALTCDRCLKSPPQQAPSPHHSHTTTSPSSPPTPSPRPQPTPHHA